MKGEKLQTGLNRTEPRLNYLDNLRVSVVVLVVLHHIAMVYGAFAPFYYVEQPFQKSILIFCILNQSWFMGALFLLAGYFTPPSFDRKGSRSFISSKLLRLGIPALIFYFVLNPLSSLGVYAMPPAMTGIHSGPAWTDYRAMLGLGPLWFAVLLLAFQLAYAAIAGMRGMRSSRRTKTKKPRPLIAIVLFSLGLAGISWAWRMLVPIGKAVWDFPSLGYLPQYVSFFAAGAILSKSNVLSAVKGKTGIAAGAVAIAALLILFPLAFSGRMFSLNLTAFGKSLGGGHWQSGVYAAFDSIFAVSWTIALIALFRKLSGNGSAPGRFMSAHSYTVYIIHIPVLIAVSVLLKDLAWPFMLKAGLNVILTLPLCFLLAWCIGKIPGAKRIL